MADQVYLHPPVSENLWEILRKGAHECIQNSTRSRKEWGRDELQETKEDEIRITDKSESEKLNKSPNIGEDVGEQNLSHTVGEGGKMVQSLWKTLPVFLKS